MVYLAFMLMSIHIFFKHLKIQVFIIYIHIHARLIQPNMDIGYSDIFVLYSRSTGTTDKLVNAIDLLQHNKPLYSCRKV